MGILETSESQGFLFFAFRAFYQIVFFLFLFIMASPNKLMHPVVHHTNGKSLKKLDEMILRSCPTLRDACPMFYVTTLQKLCYLETCSL